MQKSFSFSNLSVEQAKSVRKSILVSAAFGITSVATSFTFKAIFSSYKFEAYFTLLGLQMILTLLFCTFLKHNCRKVSGLEVPDIDRRLVHKSLFAGLLFVTNIAVGFAGLKRVNIPMFLTVRRTTTVFTLIAEYYMLQKIASNKVQLGIALTVLGALVAGYDSLNSDWIGYLWTLGNNAATAASWSATKRFSDENKIRGFGLTMYNALVALPLCVILAIVSGEVTYLQNYPHLFETQFLLALFACSTLGVTMNYVVFLCTTSTSPLATAVTGNIKDIGATVLGAYIFGDFVPTFYRILGILISFLGSGIFSVAKLQEASMEKPKQDTVVPSSNGRYGNTMFTGSSSSSSGPIEGGSPRIGTNGGGGGIINNNV